MDPIDFPIAPTVAIPKALEAANLTAKDIALFEINEAFSVVVRAAEKILGIESEKINVNGCVTLRFLCCELSKGFPVVPLLSAMPSATRGRVSSYLSCTRSSLVSMVQLASAMG